MIALPMVVDDLNVVSILCAPNEADPPLLVNSYRMLRGSVAFEFFQPIARNPPKFVQIFRRVDRKKLLQGTPLHIAWQPTAGTPDKQVRRFTRSEGLDHPLSVTKIVTKCNGRVTRIVTGPRMLIPPHLAH